MLLKLATRILRTADTRCLAKFAWNFGVKGALSVERFKRRARRGEYFPPFLYISLINSCNLRCQGCWVDVESPRESIDLEALNRLITEAKAHGNSFFGILGGEPFMHPDLMTLLGSHPDCYFQVFTNGQFITEEIAEDLRRFGNVTPLVSIEGFTKLRMMNEAGELTDKQRVWITNVREQGQALLTMVSNLLVVLCSESETQPIVNAGSLYT